MEVDMRPVRTLIPQLFVAWVILARAVGFPVPPAILSRARVDELLRLCSRVHRHRQLIVGAKFCLGVEQIAFEIFKCRVHHIVEVASDDGEIGEGFRFNSFEHVLMRRDRLQLMH